MFNRINRSLKILKLTRRNFRANQVTPDSIFYLNNIPLKVQGDSVLSMMIDIVSNDAYGLRSLRGKLSTIVDIGANVGVFSLHARTLFPNAKILAFEPSFKSRKFLEKNTQEFNIEVYPYGVSNRVGKGVLHEVSDMTAFYIASDSSCDLNTQECELITLDDIRAKFLISDPSTCLLKLDCEGSEYEIMQSLSLKSFGYVVGELHSCPGGEPNLGLDLLRSNNFSVDKWCPFADGSAGVFWASNMELVKRLDH